MIFPNIPIGVVIALDFETNSLDYWKPDFFVFGYSIAVAGQDNAWYFDIRETFGAVGYLRALLYSSRLVIAQNAQFEYQCFRWLNGDPRQVKWYCTMVADCLINEHHLTYNLEDIAHRRGYDSQKSVHLDRIAAATGCGSHREVLSRLSEFPAAMVAPYCRSDALDAMNIYLSQQHDIEDQSLERVLALEMRLLPVLADMSYGGVLVDLEAAYAQIPLLNIQETALYKEIRAIAGEKFNVNSTPQIREFFKPEPLNKFQWRLIDGTIVGPTKNGSNPSIGQDALRAMKHPLARKMMELRKCIKLRDTFIKGHVIGSADSNGYVHTQFNQTRNDADAGTVTGRLSSTGPALQQITKRDKGNASILRAMFLPDKGQSWLCADYSQVDFRCAAHLINDRNIIDAYAADPALDYHQVVSEMTGIPRNAEYPGAPNTKQINLGLSFGAGAGKLAFMMGMPYEVKEYKGRMMYLPGPEAQKVFETYHSNLPGTKLFMKQAENIAKTTGFVKTQIGRRLRFPKGHGAHTAAGLLYQAYAADLHKWGLVQMDDMIRTEKFDARLMLSCHDEGGISVDSKDVETQNRLTATYSDFNREDSNIVMRVPIRSSSDFGANWYEASKG
jgi:DNA polymerase I